MISNLQTNVLPPGAPPGSGAAHGSAASVHFSSESNEWATPQDLFNRYDRLHQFTLDPCSTDQNAKCAKHYTRVHDGLSQDWNGERVWMNPPYGRDIVKWMKKAYDSSLAGALVVCLVPARTDTFWWHEYAAKGKIEFLRGRVKFVGGAHSAPFPSAVVTLTPPNNAISETRADKPL